jgi:Spy/CpxP family protein refolding chaperone
MRTKFLVLVAALVGSALAIAQTASTEKGGVSVQTQPGKRTFMIRHEMGKWWKDSQVAQKLQLNDGQISQLDEIFYEHRLKLIDYGAAMEKEDLKLQNLVDADVPNEGQISAQVDQTLAARGKLEREYTMMNLDLRKVLSLDQWRQLKQIREDRGLGDNVIFFKKGFMPGAGAPPLPPLPPKGPRGPAPPLPPDGDMF